MELFEDIARARAATEVAERAGASATSRALEAFRQTSREQLPETNDAIKRMPQQLEVVVGEVATNLFEDQFMALATKHYSTKQPLDALVTPGMLAHSAKLAVFSHVVRLSTSAWHLADSEIVKRIATDLKGRRDFEAAERHLAAVKSVNLFVASVEEDDRDSYIKAVKALVKRHKVHSLLFDAELIEWRPEAEFLQACADVGVRPNRVGIAEKTDAAKHGIMTVEARGAGVPALFVDSRGNAVKLSAQGIVQLGTPQVQALPSPAAAASRPGSTLAAATCAATSSPSAVPVGQPPSSAIQARIAGLRQAQLRRTARP